MNRPFKTIRHLLLLLATAAAALCPGEAWADVISYLEFDGTLKTAKATKITSSETSVTLSSYSSSIPDFYVTGDVTINGDLTLRFAGTGSRLILCDGATLTITGRFCPDNLINIFAQSTGENMGKLIIESSDDAAIVPSDIRIYGGEISVLNGGIKISSLSLYSGRLTADRFLRYDSHQPSTFNFKLYNATDFFKVNHYDITGFRKFDNSLNRSYLADGTTPVVFNTSTSIYSENWPQLEGKTIALDPSCLYDVTLPASIPGGTVAADPALAPEGRKVTLSFTPAAANLLTAASWNDGTNDNDISPASPTTAAYSTTITMPAHDVTVSATFTPAAASITSGGTTTYYLTLADAFAATNAFETKTIVILRDGIDESAETYNFNYDVKHFSIDLNGKTAKIGTISKYGRLTITDSSTGHTGKAEFAMVVNGGDVTIDGANVSMSWLENREPNFYELRLDNGATLTTDDAEWDSKTVLLDHGSHWTAKGWLDLGYADGFEFGINDRNSWVQLVDCSLHSFYAADHLRALLTPLAPIGTTININNATDNNVVLRKTWSLDLRNAFNEISAGVPSATVQYFDGGTTAPTASTFDPSVYIPAGETGANEISEINNSDGKDHYIIMHIVPHEGDPLATNDPDYWTNERLLYVMEGASAASRSRGPGISLNLPYLLKADEYDADIDPAVTDMQPRHDGAGWYYYKLPASHNVANGYTKSTLQGLAAPKFLLSEDTRLSLNGSTLTVTDGTANGWKAELTYDQISFPFDGAGHCPKTKKIVVYNGGTPLITLDSTPASENPLDEAKANAAQAEIAAQITDGYDPAPLTISDYHNICSHQTTLYGWFSGQDGTTHYSITVPFPGSGTSTDDPWLIQGGENIALLSKCVNLGQRCFENEFLKLDPDPSYSYDMSTVSGFEPIGMYPSYPFCGSFSGKDVTISNLSYTYNPSMAVILDDDDPKKGIGLFGQVGLSLGDPVERKIGSVEDVTLLDCTFASLADEVCYLGSIAGNVDYGKVSNCLVKASGDDTGSVSATKSGCKVGALFGNLGIGTALSKNYYDYKVRVSYNDNGNTVNLSGYNPRGVNFTDVTTGTDDFDPATPTLSDCAMLWVKKASLGTITKPTGSTSTIAFSQKTPGNNCYALDGDEVLYAVDQPITLTVTEGQSTDGDIRTFYDSFTGLTVNGSTDGVDLANKSFTMPAAEATIDATFTPSKWFTINTVNYNADDPSQPHAYNWMTFYHEWTDGTGTAAKSANYKVTNYDNHLLDVEVLTVSRVNPADGSFALVEVDGGICYSGVPTIFHYAVANDATAVLPQKLKFTPVDPNDPQAPTGGYAEPTVAKQFQGTVSGKTLSATDKCYVLNNAGDFILAYPTDGDDKIAAHKSYIDLSIEDNGNTQAPARLVSVGDETGIGRLAIDGSSDGASDGPWYSLDGRRLNGQPTRKGIYIYKGKKTVIK